MTDPGIAAHDQASRHISRGVELADHGGHFYRTDFQVHTPRDGSWKGPKATSAEERDAYAKRFVAACRQKGLQAVAITDHHDLLFAPLIRQAAASETDASGLPLDPKQRLIVFPGIELTLALARQALLILDADFPDDRLPQVLQALAITPHDPADSKLPDVQALDHIHSLAELHQKLDEHQWLRGRYIVLPNATDSGHKSIMRKGMQAEYREMPCVGGYLDGSIEKVGAGNKRIFAGEDPAWGNKPLAIFQTSDSRSDSFEDLGRHSTWVKWAEPTAEAIRQACLAQESRVAQADPPLPNAWVSRVVVSQSKFMGRVDVALNSQYTALIGGRGTGKSTLLDYLRWALCDQPAQATEDDEVVDPRVRQRKLIEATLKPVDGHVEVHCVINGIAHVVRRYSSDGSVQLKVADGEFSKVREAHIQSLLPIQAYSQKQLSSVAIRKDELLRFVTSPIQAQLEDIERVQAEVAGRLRENYGTLQRYRTLSGEIQRSEIRISSLAEQAQALRDGLAGLSDEDRKTLDSKAAYDDARSSRSSWLQAVDSAESDVSHLVSALDASLAALQRPDEVPEEIAGDVDSLLEASSSAIRTVRETLVQLGTDLGQTTGPGGAVSVSAERLAAKLLDFDQEYASVKKRSSAHEAKLAELAKLEEQQRQARELVQRQRKELESLGDPMARHVELRTELTTTRQKRTQALASQCAELSTASDGLIKASLASGRGFATAQAKFKSLIAGSNVRTNKVDAFFDELAKTTDPAMRWEGALAELESLMLLEPDTEINSEQTPILSGSGLTVTDQKKLAPKLTPDGWLDLSLAELADYPEFEYRAKESEYIPFDSASAGQQASALLATLLSQGGTPLIIDQPEDDLDSDTVQQIVTKIWASKSGRQLIFSSHNANLVVNGDADLVLVCAYVKSGDQSAGHIKLEGAIDVAAVRNEITAVMEGGERAFRLRKEKYGF